MTTDIHNLDLELQEFYTKNKDGKGSGFAMRAIQQYSNNYTRLQIEKDRERVKANIKTDLLNPEIACQVVDNTPIQLD